MENSSEKERDITVKEKLRVHFSEPLKTLKSSVEKESTKLKTELDTLVKDKKLKNYPGTATDYLNSIYKSNEIFTDKRKEKDKVEFLKQVKEWIKHPENIAGVNFGKELLK